MTAFRHPQEAVDLRSGLTQKAAARLLGVSVSFLRASSCPKALLPGNGPKGRFLLRYDRAALLAWAGLSGSGAQQDAPQSASAGSRNSRVPAQKSGGKSGADRQSESEGSIA